MSNNEIVNNGLQEAIFGNPFSQSTQLSQTDTLFKNNRWYLISNMRQLLSQTYVEHGLVATMIDVPVDDALRGGFDISTKQLDEEEISELKSFMESEDDINTIAQSLKWSRLYGGGGILVISENDYQQPFKFSEVQQGSKLELRAVDMWELFWDLQNTGDYSQAINQNMDNVEYYRYYGRNIHNSRVLTVKGKQAPSFLRPRLRGWGLSVLETVVRSINQYLKASDLTFEVLDEFKIDVYKVKNLVNTLLSPQGDSKVRQRIDLANKQKNYQHAITMDAEDDYVQKQVSFGGLAEAQAEIRRQVAADLRMPMTKLFGMSSAGFNSGEDDIENYNSMVESEIRSKIKFHVIKIVKLRAMQLYGVELEDVKIEFEPLRIMTSEQEEAVKTQKFNRALQAKQSGEITSEEFRDILNKENLLDAQFETNESAISAALDEHKARGNNDLDSGNEIR